MLLFEFDHLLGEAEPPRKQTKTQRPDPFAANWDDILGPGAASDNVPAPASEPAAEPPPERAAPELRRATQADTLRATQNITPTERMRDLMNRMRDIPAQDDAGYPEPDDAQVPVVRVDTGNLPRVANQALQAAGVQNPQWHQVANLPGNMSRAIRSLGRMLFGAMTRTPTEDIYMVGNVMGQGPNTSQEVNAVAAWIRANGRDLGSGGIDFDAVIPGYEADIRTYDAAGIRWLVVQDEFGRYIYAWPRDDSRAIANPDEPGLLR